MPKGLFLCAVTCTKRHFENKKKRSTPNKGRTTSLYHLFSTENRPRCLLTEPPVRRYFRKLRRFSPVDRTNYIFRTSVRNFHRSPLSETDANEKPFVRSLSNCKCTTLQAILASVLRLFLCLLQGNNERLGKIDDFFKSPHCQCCKCNLPLCQRHTQQSFRIFSTISLT